MKNAFQTKDGTFDLQAWRDTVEGAAARFRRMGLDEDEVSRRVIAYMEMIEGRPIVRLEPVATDTTKTRKPAKRKPGDSRQLSLFE